MNLLGKKVIAVFLLASFGSGAAHAELLGGVAAGSYGDTTYQEIQDIELKSFPAIMAHPYEIVIRNTPIRRMILCQLYDREGKFVSSEIDNSGNGETRMFFTDKVLNASTRCFYVSVERRIRP